MALVPRAGYCARVALLLLATGCGLSKSAVRESPPAAAQSVTGVQAAPAIQPIPAVASLPVQQVSQTPVQQISHQLPAAETVAEPCSDGLFAGQPELSLEQLTD